MTYLYDYSYGHGQIDPAAMKRGGASGFIAYIGCDDNDKNVTKAQFQALINAGYIGALVIENNATDALQGATAGDKHGRNVMTGAKSVGYDTDNCVLFWGYDSDSHSGDWPKILAAMEAFAKHVPNPGYYGDSDSIDYLHARHPDWIYWQSDSRSFSPSNPSLNTHFLQLYNDPRAHGLPVDVNDIQKTPIKFMGEDMALSSADLAAIQKAVWGYDHIPVAGNPKNPTWTPTSVLEYMYKYTLETDQRTQSLQQILGAASTGIAARVAATQAAIANVQATQKLLQTAVSGVQASVNTVQSAVTTAGQVALDAKTIGDQVIASVTATLKNLTFGVK